MNIGILKRSGIISHGILVSLFLLNGCDFLDGIFGKDKISNISIGKAEVVSSIIEMEEFPLPNCGGTSDLSQAVAMQATMSTAQSLSTTTVKSTGKKVGISELASAELEKSIENAYQQAYHTASSRTENLELKAAPGTHVVYKIQWEETKYVSIISYEEGKTTHELPYSYTLSVPKISESYQIECPSSSILNYMIFAKH